MEPANYAFSSCNGGPPSGSAEMPKTTGAAAPRKALKKALKNDNSVFVLLGLFAPGRFQIRLTCDRRVLRLAHKR